MKRKALLLASGMVLAIAIWLLVEMRPAPAGYTYQGKTVRQWLAEALTNQPVAMVAFRSMGTNAFPDFVRELKRNESLLDQIVLKGYDFLPASLKSRWPRPQSQQYYWNTATLALLNEPGISWQTVPDLIQILQNKKYKSRSWVVQLTIGIANARNRKCVPSLNALLHDPDLDVRTAAALALWKIDRQTNVAVTALNEAANSKDSSPSYMRDWAPAWLYSIHPNDESLIPLFIAQLKGTNDGLKFGAVSALEQYGTSAVAAVPALTNLLTNSTPQLRANAMQALKKIDPTNAAQYEKP
jgi:HEAT repeats